VRWTRKKTIADDVTGPLEAATNDFLTSIKRQLQETLGAAEVRAAEITRAADDQAAELAMELLNEASLMMRQAEEFLLKADFMTSKAEELEKKRGGRLRGSLDRETRMHDAIEALRVLYVAQQAEVESLGAVGSTEETAQDVPSAGQARLPAEQRESGPTRELSAAPMWEDIFRKREEGGRAQRERQPRPGKAS
jgi:hypothetical protein